MAALEKNRRKNKFLNKVEDKLREEFKGDIRKLTITQEIILIKLVFRFVVTYH